MEDIKDKKAKQIIAEESNQESSDFYTEKEPSCAYCGSDHVFGMSRVVGYFSIIENWNKSKKAELKRRQKGKYWYKED